MASPGDPEYVDSFQISSELFSVLGIGLKHGRAFLPEEDRLGATPVVIISDGLWQRLFGGARMRSVSLLFTMKRLTRLWVAPPGFRLNGDEADVLPRSARTHHRCYRIAKGARASMW